jgi:hypothetical protein
MDTCDTFEMIEEIAAVNREKLINSIRQMLEQGEYRYLSPHCDIETGQLDGTFTPEQLRAIADAMDELKPVKTSTLADFDVELIESKTINGIETGFLKLTPKN